MSDYYATSPGQLLGSGFDRLDIGDKSPGDVFECLASNLDPATGQPLRPHAREGDRVGMDFTFNAPKSVSLARELAGVGNHGDTSVEEAHREAVAYAMKYIEGDMQARVRAGGADHDRPTGNLMAYRVTHRDTRINADDQRPDPHLHDHVFVLNATFDPVEQKWKAAQLGQVKHDAPFYEAIYMNRLAGNLRDLGYGVRRKDKAFEIAGISDELTRKFSRRSEYIKEVAAKLGITRPETLDKLGATTRLGKAKELADDLSAYYVGRLTDKEKQQLASLQGQPSYECSHEKAVRFAIGHEFERQSVVEERKLYETALRHGIGSVTVEGVQREAKRQGLLVKNRDATTRDVLAEEQKIIAFAREGKGTCRPLAAGRGIIPPDATPLHPQRYDTATFPGSGQQKDRPDESKLSPEQQAICRHVWESPDRVILIRGAAGTGKTHTMKATLEGIDRPVAILAPTVPAARAVLRQDFPTADTVAAFLGDKEWQARIRGGVLYVDESGLLPIKDLSRLCDVANEQNARIILQGDPKQHKSVLRNGNMFRVLQEHADLPVAELRDIRRQSGRYKDAVAAIEAGNVLKGHDIFTELGWVRQVEGNTALVDDYFQALATKKPGQSDRDRAIILAPTHDAGDAITTEVRRRLKEAGKLGQDTEVYQLVPLHWSEAERGDLERYTGDEVMVFHRNSGTFKAGQVVPIADWKPGDHFKDGAHFSVYRASKLTLAPGDTIRTTANVKDEEGKRVDNGTYLTVRKVTQKGIEAETAAGKVKLLPLKVGHLTHGYTATSIGGQGRTVDRVFAAMGGDSLGALRAEQFYTDLSRGRQQATIYTDLSAQRLREAVQRADGRLSATELIKPKPRRKPRLRNLLERARRFYARLRDKLERVGERPARHRERQREYHGR